MAPSLFSALLRFWRKRRGLSQLDFATEAGVTPRHVSFLESGRAKPSPAMVSRLFTVLQVPLRVKNEAFRAAGFRPPHPEAAPDALDEQVRQVIDAVLERHEPWPMTVVRVDGTILRTNRAAPRLFRAFCAQAETALPSDMVTLLFDERFLRTSIVDWPRTARALVTRLHRERLERPSDPRLAQVLDRALAFPGVPAAWLEPDLAEPAPATIAISLERGPRRASFLVATTSFSAPQDVTLDELRLEGCYPVDEQTRALCRELTA